MSGMYDDEEIMGDYWTNKQDDPNRVALDLKLLSQYGETQLRSMGYMGVIDRLERGGFLTCR